MGKKLAFASLFVSGNDATASLSCSPPPSMSAASSGSTAASWQWPSCAQARTSSFDGRSSVEAEVASSSSARRDCWRSRTTRVITNLAYCDDDTADSSFVSATATASSSASAAAPEPELWGAREAEEAVIRGIRASSRLFFEPEATKSIVTASKPAAFGGATALAIDSADPYGDFRRSMEEMVLSRGGAGGEDDWGWLEEMLGWYLRANGKKTHGLIVGAFVDLLVGLSAVSN